MKTKHLSSIVLACLLIGIFASSCHRNGEKASTAGEDNTHKYNYIKDIHISNPQLALNICDTMEANGEMELFYLDHLRSAIYHNGLKMKRLSHFYGLRAVGDKRFEKTDPESYLFCLRLMAEQDYKDSRYSSAMNLSHQCVDKARKYGFPDTENKMLHLIGRCNVMIGNKEAGYKMIEEACVKALDLFKDKPDLYSADEIVFGYGTMLEMMFNQGHPEDALTCISEMERRLDMVEKSGLVPDNILDMRQCAIYALIMKIYDVTGNVKMGQHYCDKAASTKTAHSTNGDSFFTDHYIATRQYGKLLAATKNMRKMFRMTRDTISNDYVNNVLLKELEAYGAMGNDRKAKQTAMEIITLKDSLTKRSQDNDLLQLSKIYETQEKERLLVEQDRRLARQSFGLWAAVVLLALAFAFIALMIYYNRKINKRSKAAVGTISRLVEQQNELSKLRPDDITDGDTDKFVGEMCFRKAISLLEDKDEREVEEIARACGYKDGKTFVKQFESQYGLTPQEYRRWSKMTQKENKEASEMKTSFIRNMSHEIRTPLHQISGFVQLLTDPNINLEGSQKQELNNIIIQQTDHMTKMLNDLIEISEYESNEDKLDVAELPVNSILAAVRETRPAASAGVTLDYCMTSESETVTTNLEAVVRIMGCLIDNAIKNTTSGSIKVEYTNSGGKAVISVTDTGRGVPADKAEKIFERFYKIDEFVPGVGLGLTLSRAIAAKINATVTLDTSYSGGARFLVAL